MKRLTLATVFLALAACDVSQELQGAGLADGGTTNPPGTDASTTNPPGTAPTTVPPAPSGSVPPPVATFEPPAPAAIDRPRSTCVPQAPPGVTSTTLLVTLGTESRGFNDVHDLTSGRGSIFSLSGPSTLLATSIAAGSTLPYTLATSGFTAVGIAPLGTNPRGPISDTALVSYNLAASGAQVVALRGVRTASTNIMGRVIVNDGDVFYFQAGTPSRLVRAATAKNPTEVVLAEYPTSRVTAATIVGNDVYFTTYAGGTSSTSALRRVPRGGGTVQSLLPLDPYLEVEAIHEDNGTLFITSGVDTGLRVTAVGVYDIAAGTITRKDLQFPGPVGGPADTIANSRNTNVAFDGTWFYYGIRTSSPTPNAVCRGRLARIAKSAVLSGIGKTELVAENLDPVTRVRVLDGSVYVGTSGNEFFSPESYGGQVFRFNP